MRCRRVVVAIASSVPGGWFMWFVHRPASHSQAQPMSPKGIEHVWTQREESSPFTRRVVLAHGDVVAKIRQPRPPLNTHTQTHKHTHSRSWDTPVSNRINGLWSMLDLSYISALGVENDFDERVFVFFFCSPPWTLTREVLQCRFHLNVNLKSISLRLARMLMCLESWFASSHSRYGKQWTLVPLNQQTSFFPLKELL